MGFEQRLKEAQFIERSEVFVSLNKNNLMRADLWLNVLTLFTLLLPPQRPLCLVLPLLTRLPLLAVVCVGFHFAFLWLACSLIIRHSRVAVCARHERTSVCLHS